MIGNLIGCLFVLFILFGLLCNLTGDENKGTQIINNCVTAIVIYAMIIVIFSAKNSEVIKLNIPFWNGVVKYGTLKNYLNASAGGFALDFVQLVTLVLLINWVSNIMSFDKAGFVGILTSKFIIVFIGILIYGFVMHFIEKNIFFKWVVYVVECIITGGNYNGDKTRGLCERLHIRLIKAIKYRKGYNSLYIIIYCYSGIYVYYGFAI